LAQIAIGLEGGLTSNTWHTDISNRPTTDLTAGLGFTIGAPFRYKVRSWLYLTAIPGLVQKGYSINRTDSLTGEYEHHTNTYIQLPFGISLVCGSQRLQLGLGAGPYAGYWLSGRIKGRTADIFSANNNNGQTSDVFQLSSYDQQYSFLSQRDNRWEAGWWLGPEMQYRLTGAFRLTADARYYQSLTSQEKAQSNPISAYNQTWTFSIGGLWSPGKPKPHP
jgi:hypothetical protein